MPSLLPPRPPASAAPRRRFYAGRVLASARTIEDLRAMALSRLPRFVAEYVEGGAEEERTLAANRRAFDARSFAPRVLRDMTRRDLSASLLGRAAALPIAIAPTGFNGMLWPAGDLALARAATAAGIPYGQSTVSNSSVADVAAVPGIRHWFQLYVYGDEDIWGALIATARSAGCEALILTVDGPVMGNREWDRRNYRPGRAWNLSMRSRLEALRHPAWLWRTLLKPGMPRFVNLERFAPEGQRDLFGVAAWATSNGRVDLDWSFVRRVRELWPGKLLVKGVQHVDDVRLAAAAGADGIVISNHGGRQLDRAGATLDLVRPARAAAGKGFTILVDSGFRRGTEIVQALALGADGVLLGRAMLYGLAAGGEAGVARAIEILREEIDRTLALLGTASVAGLGEDVFAASVATEPQKESGS